ncbi:MAG: hypothetical protein KatS3mg024_2414 [Armatimonadota bacterium]|nr:MAG: hypothetical protein KatS3mg024_2414 [Armatimonadota bacterium]
MSIRRTTTFVRVTGWLVLAVLTYSLLGIGLHSHAYTSSAECSDCRTAIGNLHSDHCVFVELERALSASDLVSLAQLSPSGPCQPAVLAPQQSWTGTSLTEHPGRSPPPLL